MDTKRLNQEPLTLSPSSSSKSDCNSPEFEFWMLRNPSFPQPNLHSADELFVDGVLLPLHLLSATNKPDPPHQPGPEKPNSESPVHDPEPGPRPDSSPAITESSSSTLTASKRWKDIFRKSEKKNAENNTEEKEKEKGKKKERRSGASSAELNINIWPFSRSRSAGNSGTRPKLFPRTPSTRKVNSAPCSRSNSSGDSKSKKWPSSPSRAGVHVGRSSPVWQVRRGGSTAKNSETLNAEKGSKKRETATNRRSKVASSGGGKGSAKARVLNLNVPMCIGYRHHLSCSSDENSAIAASGAAATNGGNSGNDGGSGSNIFNLRSLFAKKSIVTSH